MAARQASWRQAAADVASRSAPIITATPPKPSSTPASLAGVMRSSRVKTWATITPQIGVVALRIEARPLAICVWLQANSVKGGVVDQPARASRRALRAAADGARRIRRKPKGRRGEGDPDQHEGERRDLAHRHADEEEGSAPKHREERRIAQSRPLITIDHRRGVAGRGAAAASRTLLPKTRATDRRDYHVRMGFRSANRRETSEPVQ